MKHNNYMELLGHSFNNIYKTNGPADPPKSNCSWNSRISDGKSFCFANPRFNNKISEHCTQWAQARDMVAGSPASMHRNCALFELRSANASSLPSPSAARQFLTFETHWETPQPLRPVDALWELYRWKIFTSATLTRFVQYWLASCIWNLSLGIIC